MSEIYNLAAANDDTLHTLIFSSLPHSNHEYWEILCDQINSTIKNLSNGYIWHREEFKVYLPIISEEICATPMHLIATTCFGDNIEDEWFIIYLIMEISKAYTDLVIQVTDSDGDFLLIEAADSLPMWANPENTENRVFIFNNMIHLIPPDLADVDKTLTIKDALALIVKYPNQTRVKPAIHSAILKRIKQYPERIAQNFHRVIVSLPLDIAALLTLKPSLIAPIVTTYCNHDIIDSKACSKMTFTDCVYVEVTFTKCLYAMLLNCKLIGSGKKTKCSNEDKNIVLGLKITNGFQMLMKTANKDIFGTKEFQKFLSNLKRTGYFKNNIDNSKEYNSLLENAKIYFLDTECSMSDYVSNCIADIMATDEFQKCKENLNKTNKTNEGLTEDNDEWLNIKPSQLNEMLNDRYGNDVNFQNEDLVTPSTVTSKLANFLNQSSDFQGVDTKSSNVSDNSSIHFDADQFVECLENMMNLVLGDANSSTDQDSDCEGDMFDAKLDAELATELKSYEDNKSDTHKVVSNLTQSIKEEGLSGPSSNLLSSIGINKTDLLDSDDD